MAEQSCYILLEWRRTFSFSSPQHFVVIVRTTQKIGLSSSLFLMSFRWHSNLPDLLSQHFSYPVILSVASQFRMQLYLIFLMYPDYFYTAQNANRDIIPRFTGKSCMELWKASNRRKKKLISLGNCIYLTRQTGWSLVEYFNSALFRTVDIATTKNYVMEFLKLTPK